MKPLLYALLLLAASPAAATLVVEDPWARATPPGASVAGGYLVIRNTGPAPDRLVGASSPIADRVEMHVSFEDDGIMRMRQQDSLAIPAGGHLELKPGAGHLMFVGLKQPFKEGQLVPLILRFEHGGELRTELHVGRIGARAHSH